MFYICGFLSTPENVEGLEPGDPDFSFLKIIPVDSGSRVGRPHMDKLL